MTTFTRNPLSWDEIHTARRWGTCPEPMMARFVKRRLSEGAHVLDVGCGIGANSFWLASEGYRVDAVDISPAAIERMRNQRAYRVWKVDAWEGDVAKLPPCPWLSITAPCDAVVDVTTLQHITGERMMIALQNVRLALKPGGWFFSMTATDRHDEAAMSGMPARRESRLAVTALYKAAGFEISAIETSEHSDRGMTISHWCLECTRA